jgi:hypothetical protein
MGLVLGLGLATEEDNIFPNTNIKNAVRYVSSSPEMMSKFKN